MKKSTNQIIGKMLLFLQKGTTKRIIPFENLLLLGSDIINNNNDCTTKKQKNDFEQLS